MKSFNAFRLIIDLFSRMWDALRGRPRPPQITQQDTPGARGEDVATAPKPAAPDNESKRVMTASEPTSTREAAVTATIYIEAVETQSADDNVEQTIIVETDSEERDFEDIAFVETDAPVMENDEAAGPKTETMEAAVDAYQPPQPAEDVPQVQREDANGHVAEVHDDAERMGTAIPEEGTAAEADAIDEAPAEIFVELSGKSVALTSLLESLLFVSDVALEPEQAAKVLPCTVEQVHMGLQRLRLLYQQEGRGLRVQERGGRYLLVTMPVAAPIIESFLNLDLDMRLSGPALEALAVVAYRQPVTRAQIEAVRGVDCGHVLRVLLQHELIEEAGRLETVGRPILYGVTDRFLQHFGLTSMNELPKLETSDADMLWAATQLAEEAAESDESNTAESPA